MNTEQFKFIESITRHWFFRHLFSKDILEFIACQFALESNFGKSELATLHNNYSGMKIPHRRLYYGLVDSDSPFLFYSGLDNCIIDWCAWFFYTRPHSNVTYDLEAFKIHLKNTGYCPEKDYINKINIIYLQLKLYQNERKN